MENLLSLVLCSLVLLLVCINVSAAFALKALWDAVTEVHLVARASAAPRLDIDVSTGEMQASAYGHPNFAPQSPQIDASEAPSSLRKARGCRMCDALRQRFKRLVRSPRSPTQT